MTVNYDEQVAHRAKLLAAGLVRLADDDDPDSAPGRVVEDSEATREILWKAAGDDCAVMVLVAWTRTYLRPEYAEDLVAVEVAK
jgi:hypothetical protein